MNWSDWGAVGSFVVRWVVFPVLGAAGLTLGWTHTTIYLQEAQIRHLKEELASVELEAAVRRLPNIIDGLESAGMGGERYR